MVPSPLEAKDGERAAGLGEPPSCPRAPLGAGCVAERCLPRLPRRLCTGLG